MNKNFALDYTQKILSGKIIANKKIKQACKRIHNDLERSENEKFPYYFENEKANKAIIFQ